MNSLFKDLPRNQRRWLKSTISRYRAIRLSEKAQSNCILDHTEKPIDLGGASKRKLFIDIMTQPTILS